MISIYKKYHIAYWCIGILLLISFIAALVTIGKFAWYVPVLLLIPVVLLIFVDAFIFTRLASQKLTKEVIVLYGDCRIREYIDNLQKLFAGKKGTVVSLYNVLLERGYAAAGEYDKVYECSQKIKSRVYRAQQLESLIDYYINMDRIEDAKKEIEELRKLTGKIKNAGLKKSCETSIRNAEYSIRIKQGEYEGAVEHFTNTLNDLNPLLTISKVSYSYTIGKVLLLQGEPEKARAYLQTAYDLGGDTKYKRYAEERLKEI